MTAIVFALQPEQVCIAMDTLVIEAHDRMPLSFQRKFRIDQQANLVIAGTGHAGFINSWFGHHQANLSGTSIDDLNVAIPDLFRASAKANGGLRGLTVTIYHFGYSAIEQRYVGYAYRSESDFRSDRLQYALGFKPVVPVEPTDDIRFPEFLIDIIVRQQEHDNLQPKDKRLGIGGEIEFVVMSQGGINVETVHQFASREADSNYIQRRAEA